MRLFPMAGIRVENRVATKIGRKEIGSLDWFSYTNTRLAARAADMLARMTGNHCEVIKVRKHYEISRLDITGKEVRPR